MKTTVVIILSILISACSEGHQAESRATKDLAIVDSTPIVAKEALPIVTVSQPAVVASSVQQQTAACDMTSFEPCAAPPGMTLCDATTYIPCQTPTWVLISAIALPLVSVTYCPQSSEKCEESPAKLKVRHPSQ